MRWNEMSRIWAEQGHSVTVIAGMVHYGRGRKYAHCRGRWVVEEQPFPNVRIIRTHVSEWYNVNWAGRLWGYFTFLVSGLWAALFRARGSYDVLIVTSPPLLLGLLGVAVARWKRLPLVTEVRDLWPDVPVQMGILKNRWLIRLAFALEKWLYKHSRQVVVLTPFFRSELIEQKKLPPNRVVVMPNAADFQITDPLLNTFDPAAFRQQQHMNDDFWIVYTGAHGVANRLEQVIEAASLLRSDPVKFLLIGDGMDKPNLLRKTQESQIENIRFLGSLPREEAFRYVLAANAGVVTMQQREIFKTMYTNKMFEYMAARKPILMAIDGASRQLVEEANAGLFVEAENPTDMAEKIRYYVTNPEFAVQQGMNGYTYVKRHFDRETIARAYLKLIEHVSGIR